MSEIPPSLPLPSGSAKPAFSLPTGSLPEGLKPGESLSARVLAQVSAGRYALSIGGHEVTANSALALSPGDQLQLVVRQTGTRVLMDLVPLGHQPGFRPDGTGEAPVASGGPAAAPAAAEAEFRGFLARGAPLGELLAESLRMVSAADETADSAAPAGTVRSIVEGLRQLLLDSSATQASGQTGGEELAGTVASLPARITGLLVMIEGRLAEVIRSLPGAAALGALAELLEALPASAAGPAQGANAQTAALLQKLLGAIDASGRPDGAVPQLPAELRTALAALPEREFSVLRQMVAEREREAIGSSPQAAALAGAHRALAAAQDRLDAARLWGLSASVPAQSFSCVELPLSGVPEDGAARLRVLVRKEGEGGPGRGQGSRGTGRGTARAVLDLDMSALGAVWSEMILSGRNLAVRIELPDRERSGFVAGQLHELEERLAAHGIEPSVSAVAAGPSRRRGPDDPGHDAAPDAGGLDLWA